MVKWQRPYSDNTIIRDRQLFCLLAWHIWEWLTAPLIFTHIIYFSHTDTQYPSRCPAEKSVCAPLIWLLLVVCISPEAENRDRHLVSRYTCHAMVSADSKQSKVLVMPPELALICMRAGTGLWCNCSSSEGQCLCPGCARYQSSDIHTTARVSLW